MIPSFLRNNQAVAYMCHLALIVSFISTSVAIPRAVADQVDLPPMPIPGAMINLSTAYTPSQLKGIIIHPENALKFDFIILKGDKPLYAQAKQDEYRKLIKYFLASLAIPDENQWVNLSPYEKNRIIEDDFGKTEMGRDLLAQDYILKQITASLIYPEKNLGQRFWDRVYQKAYAQFGSTNIPINTFNKVWIVPDDALIYENGNMAYVVKNHLKVMLEEDYLSLKNHTGLATATKSQGINKLGSQVVREVILPELEKEVNENENFAGLRQVFSGMVLAAWYKRVLKESLLGKIYMDRAKVKGIDQDPQNNQLIYQRYLQAFKKGVYNYIKEDVDKYSHQMIPRKYFSGGATEYSYDHAMAGVGDGKHEVLKIEDRLSATQGANEAMLVEAEEVVATALSEDKAMATGPLDGTPPVHKVPETHGFGLKQEYGSASPMAETVINIPDGFADWDQDRKNEHILNQLGMANVVKVSHQGKNHILSRFKDESNNDFAKRIINWGNNFTSNKAMLSENENRILAVVDRLIAFAESPEANPDLNPLAIDRRIADLLVGFSPQDIIQIYNNLKYRIETKPSTTEFATIGLYHLLKTVDFFSKKEPKTVAQILVAYSLRQEATEENIQDYTKEILENLPLQEIQYVYESASQAISQQAIPQGNRNINVLLNTIYSLYPAGKNPDTPNKAMGSTAQKSYGGIDFNAANLNLFIKRDGRGVPLPLSQQDFSHIHIDGLVPVILGIKPATSFPILAQMAQSTAV